MTDVPTHALTEWQDAVRATEDARYREQQRRLGRPVPEPAPAPAPSAVAPTRRRSAATKSARKPPPAAPPVPPGHLLLTPAEVAELDRLLATHPDLPATRRTRP